MVVFDVRFSSEKLDIFDQSDRRGVGSFVSIKWQFFWLTIKDELQSCFRNIFHIQSNYFDQLVNYLKPLIAFHQITSIYVVWKYIYFRINKRCSVVQCDQTSICFSYSKIVWSTSFLVHSKENWRRWEKLYHLWTSVRKRLMSISVLLNKICKCCLFVLIVIIQVSIWFEVLYSHVNYPFAFFFS